MRTRNTLLAAVTLLLPLAACDETPVNLPEATTVSVAATEMTMTVGDAAPLAAQVLDQQGRAMSGRAVAYATDNPSVASVDAGGTVRALSPGTANVTAAFGSTKASARVTVSRDERGFVQTLDVLADSVTLDVLAGTPPLVIQAFDGYGKLTCPNVTVHSSDPAVATGAPAGACRLAITPKFRGTATLVVQAERGVDSVRVRVTSGTAVALISSVPAAAQHYAGNRVTYGVKVLDTAGNPIAGRTVHFNVSAGRLSAETGTTDANGVATVAWTLPTDLRTFGNQQRFSYSTTLPSGAVGSGDYAVYVSAAAAASMTLYRFDWTTYTLVPVPEGATLWSPLYTWVDVAASAADAYGNPRTDGFSFSVTGAGYQNCTGWTIDGLPRFCWYGYNVGTGVLTVTNGSLSKSWNVDFH